MTLSEGVKNRLQPFDLNLGLAMVLAKPLGHIVIIHQAVELPIDQRLCEQRTPRALGTAFRVIASA